MKSEEPEDKNESSRYANVVTTATRTFTPRAGLSKMWCCTDLWIRFTSIGITAGLHTTEANKRLHMYTYTCAVASACRSAAGRLQWLSCRVPHLYMARIDATQIKSYIY